MKEVCPLCDHDRTFTTYGSLTAGCYNCGHVWTRQTFGDSATAATQGKAKFVTTPAHEPEVKVKDCFPFEQFANRVTYTPPGQNFTIPTQTYQLPFITCEICGAAVNAEPRPMQMHADWHSLWGVRP